MPWAAADITGFLEVDPRSGLTATEAGKRLQQDGPNRLAEGAAGRRR
jgi:hypothetical protein